MDRRAYLAAVATSAGVTGCVGTAGTVLDTTVSGPPLSIRAPTVERGTTGAISITALSARSLRFSRGHDLDARVIRYGDADLVPAPKSVYTARPPTWVWSTQTDVTGTVPVDVPTTLPPGEYRYTVALERGEGGDEVTEEFAVTVPG